MDNRGELSAANKPNRKERKMARKKSAPSGAVTEYRLRDIPLELWRRVKSKAAMAGTPSIGDYIKKVLDDTTKGEK
jgi:hypothetical protein